MAQINEIIHQPARLRIMAALVALEQDAEVDFAFLRDHLGLSDGNLGAHLEKLDAAGYTVSRKTFVGRKPRTFIRVTAEGRRALDEHVQALKNIVGLK